jgi:hypothetical protein
MSNSWAFAPGFPDQRRRALEAVPSFEAVVDLVASEMRDITVSDEEGQAPGMEGSMRPILTFNAPAAFDAFFNSAAGYRGQFWQDPDLGQAANGRIIRRLMDALIEALNTAKRERLRSIDVKASLSAISAKIWIHEDDFPLAAPTHDLAVEPWRSACERGVRLANFGLCAPANGRILVFGAFIDRYGHERVPRDKIYRRFELHQYGFT